MRTVTLLALLSASVCWAQQPQQNPAPQPSAQTTPLVIPAGTTIPARLTSQITVKSRPGDTVRAETAFPVTVGTRVAIPAGSYLEGEIVRLNKRRQSVQMRFTRLVYSNGYSVDIVGAAAQPNSSADNPNLPPPGLKPMVSSRGFAGQTSLASSQPFPQPQSHVGLFIGIAVASAVATLLLAILLRRHSGAGNSVLFDAGWQFEIVLKVPVSIDAARIADILAAPAAP